MDPSTVPSTITIAPLGDDEEEDSIITDETPGRTNTLDLTSLDPAMTIKTEPVEKPPQPVAATIVTRPSNVTSVFPRQPPVAIRQTSLLRNLVPVTRGIFRFSSPGTVTVPAGGHVMSAAKNTGQMILIPTSGSNCTTLALGQNQAPIKLIPIQPKKSQAVVAPQAKQTVVVSGSPIATSTSAITVVPPELRKGIISFSSDEPDNLSIRRQRKIINPQYGVSGMIFNSRTVTAGGRVRYTKDYLCNLCKHMSDSYSSFRQHFSSTHMFNCDHCTYKAFSRYEVVIHTKNTHPEAVDDLKGYEMFEEPDTSTTKAAVTPQSTLETTKTTAARLTTNTSLVTVPVLSSGGKLMIQSGTRANTTLTSTTANSNLPPNTSPDAPIGSYFTYKIVSGSKSEPKKYECDLCQYQTPNIQQMYDHASSHTMADLNKMSTNSTTWECFYCSYKSPHQPNVVQHVTLVHPDKHIQLKRYTSTSVIRSTALSTSVTPTISQSSPVKIDVVNAKPKSLLTPITPGTSLIIKPHIDAASKKIIFSTSSAQPVIPTTVNISDDDTSPAKSTPTSVATPTTPEGVRQKTSKDVDEEDDGTAMWGCYYCEFEDQDRHNVVAHVKADHAGRKIVITRRRVAAKEQSETEEKIHEETEDLLLDTLKEADQKVNPEVGGRKNYESLIIKLKKSNKTDKKIMDNIQNLGHVANASDSEGEELPSLDNGVRDLLSGGEGTDPEMPKLEKMVSGRKSPRMVGPLKSAKSKTEKRKSTGTRVKSDLAFDQAEVVFLDHIPEDLNVDVSQLYVYNKTKQEAECNICHRSYTGKMASSHMREHLMIHTGERIWGCPYCDFCCNRRFALYTHVKRIHPDQPIKLVRRRPYQLGAYKSAGRKDPGGIQYTHKGDGSGSSPGTVGPQKPKLRGPRCRREREFLETSEFTWTCPYCTRKDVFKGAIKIHMKLVHPDQDHARDPEKDERPLDLLRKLTAENQLPMKEAKVKIINVEDMDRYDVLREILAENAESLSHDLDLEDVERASMPILSPAAADVKPPVQMTMMRHAKYQCPYCPTRGVRPSTVKSHIITNHPDKELYIHDLRVSRRSNNQHHLFVCRDQDCKFMTVMKQALYAHVAKNPTHINTGLVPEGESLEELALAPRVPSLRVRKHENYNDDDISMEIEEEPLPEKPVEPSRLKSPLPLTVENIVDEPTNKEVVMPIVIKKKVKPQSDTKKRRVKPPLPADHRKGTELKSVNMTCKYCSSVGVTTDQFMMKEHLSLDHNTLIPIAIDIRQKDLRKSSRIHMCPMIGCSYVTYFEEAFLIHLNEQHSDVSFPFRSNIRAKVVVAEAPQRPADSDLSDAEWETHKKSSSKRRVKGSSDDEPEWTPSSRSRKRKSNRFRRSSGRQEVQESPLDMMHEINDIEIPPLRSKPKPVKPSKDIDWSSETILEYPSAQSMIGTRFKCSFCKDCYENLSEVKQHLLDSHSKTATFCTDLHAKYMRKKQTIFLCMQPSCEFCCKTWGALQDHMHNEHNLPESYVRELELAISQSPLLRKQTKKSKTRENRVQPIHSNEVSMDTIEDDNESTITGKTQGNSDSDGENSKTQASGFRSIPVSDDTIDNPMETESVDQESPMEKPSEVSSRKESRKRKGQPRKLTRTPVPESLAGEEGETEREAQREGSTDERPDSSTQQEAEPTADVEDLECENLVATNQPPESSGPGENEDGDSDSGGHESSDSDGDATDDEKNDSDVQNESESSSGSDVESEPSKVETPVGNSPAQKPTDSDAKLSGKDDGDDVDENTESQKPIGQAAMDVMFQCSHCTYLSTDRENIQLHLNNEHDCAEPEFTQIGAEFSYDGRVNMSVGEVAKAASDESDNDEDDSENSHNLSKDSITDEISQKDDAEKSQDHSLSKIEPLKLAIKKTSEGDSYTSQKRRKSTDSDSFSEKSPKRARNENESEKSSEESSEEEEEDDSKNESSEESSEEDSEEDSSSESESESDSETDSSESKDSSRNEC